VVEDTLILSAAKI